MISFVTLDNSIVKLDSNFMNIGYDYYNAGFSINFYADYGKIIKGFFSGNLNDLGKNHWCVKCVEEPEPDCYSGGNPHNIKKYYSSIKNGATEYDYDFYSFITISNKPIWAIADKYKYYRDSPTNDLMEILEDIADIEDTMHEFVQNTVLPSFMFYCLGLDKEKNHLLDVRNAFQEMCTLREWSLPSIAEKSAKTAFTNFDTTFLIEVAVRETEKLKWMHQTDAALD